MSTLVIAIFGTVFATAQAPKRTQTLQAPVQPATSRARTGIFESETVRFQVELVVQGLRQPTAMQFLPDGRALITERFRAKAHLLELKTRTLSAVSGLPEILKAEDTGPDDETGLHAVLLHPDYAANGWIYICYSEGNAARSTTVVDRVQLREQSFVNRQRIFTADAYADDHYHYGGRLAFVGRYLFITIGDRHNEERAQELSSHAGKIVRIYDDGTVPADNPFVQQQDAKPEIWSYGHRNPQGLVVHPDSGELWSHEHGPLSGDEFNFIRRGANYGWPIVSYGWQYTGGPIGQGIVRKEGVTDPQWVWTPAIAPSGLIVYTGSKFSEWNRSVFVGAMARGHLNRLVFRDGYFVLEERLMYRRSGRVRMVAQGPDGYIYFGNDDGEILRLMPSPQQK